MPKDARAIAIFGTVRRTPSAPRSAGPRIRAVTTAPNRPSARTADCPETFQPTAVANRVWRPANPSDTGCSDDFPHELEAPPLFLRGADERIGDCGGHAPSVEPTQERV